MNCVNFRIREWRKLQKFNLIQFSNKNGKQKGGYAESVFNSIDICLWGKNSLYIYASRMILL